jgi:replicative DNA helicase
VTKCSSQAELFSFNDFEKETVTSDVQQQTSTNKIESLRQELGASLKRPDQIKSPAGVPTGHKEFDDFLIWNGLPKGEISLFASQPGFGATTLLSYMCSQVTLRNQWAAWVDHPDYSLCPWALMRQNCKFDRLLMVSAPQSEKQLMWAMSELCSLSLFEVIVCDISQLTIKRHHLIKIKQLAKRYQVAMVFKDEKPQRFLQSFYAVALQFNQRFLEIQRAQHRPTPMRMQRRTIYENFMPQLTEAREAFRRRELPSLQPEGALS